MKLKEPATQHRSATKVLPCACQHTFQDATYGRGKRLHNLGGKGWRCTVCSHEKL